MTWWSVLIPDSALSRRWHVSWRHAAYAIVSLAFAPAAMIVVVVPAAVPTFSPATIRIAPVGLTVVSTRIAALESFLFYAPITICFTPVASSILTTGAAPAFIIRFAFGPLHVCAAFGVSHCPARRGYKKKRYYQ